MFVQDGGEGASGVAEGAEVDCAVQSVGGAGGDSVACFETPPLLDGSVSKHAAGFRNPHLSHLIGSS